MRLLILSCSATKADHPARAIDLYDGPSFRTLRAWIREAKREELAELSVWILSAEHGLIPFDQELEPYDRLMTNDRAEELRPAVTAKLAELVQELKPSEVFMFLGQKYSGAVAPTTWSGDVPLDRAQGKGIGYKLGALRSWLQKEAS